MGPHSEGCPHPEVDLLIRGQAVEQFEEIQGAAGLARRGQNPATVATISMVPEATSPRSDLESQLKPLHSGLPMRPISMSVPPADMPTVLKVTAWRLLTTMDR